MRVWVRLVSCSLCSMLGSLRSWLKLLVLMMFGCV